MNRKKEGRNRISMSSGKSLRSSKKLTRKNRRKKLEEKLGIKSRLNSTDNENVKLKKEIFPWKIIFCKI